MTSDHWIELRQNSYVMAARIKTTSTVPVAQCSFRTLLE